MLIVRVIGEAARAAAAARVSSAVITTIVAGCVLAITLTTGQSAATESQVLERLDDAGARLVRFERTPGARDLPPRAVGLISGLSDVAWVVGSSAPVDGRNVGLGQGGERVGFRHLVGALPSEVRLPPRMPNKDEAVVPPRAAARLGLLQGVGAVELTDRRQLAVVGTFDAHGPLAFLGDSGIVLDTDEVSGLQRIDVLVEDVSAVAAVTSAALRLIAPQDPAEVTVVGAQALADLDGLLRRDLRASGRLLLAGVLGLSGLLIAAVTTAQALLRSRDLGRRRALGATRSIIAALLVLQTLLPAAVGSVLGAAAGVAIVWFSAHLSPPPLAFLGGAATLATLAAATASVGPAILLGRRDPLAVLRNP